MAQAVEQNGHHEGGEQQPVVDDGDKGDYRDEFEEKLQGNGMKRIARGN